MNGAKEHKKEERGQRWTHIDASLTHLWKRGRDPHCTQTAFQSRADMERVRAYLPQSSQDKPANTTRLAILRMSTNGLWIISSDFVLLDVFFLVKWLLNPWKCSFLQWEEHSVFHASSSDKIKNSPSLPWYQYNVCQVTCTVIAEVTLNSLSVCTSVAAESVLTHLRVCTVFIISKETHVHMTTGSMWPNYSTKIKCTAQTLRQLINASDRFLSKNMWCPFHFASSSKGEGGLFLP